uniref:Uncharacterized protein n=1 Tax=Anguilla anguilla TaxID=7936 RepID=A0A0E9UKG9_ANGAN
MSPSLAKETEDQTTFKVFSQNKDANRNHVSNCQICEVIIMLPMTGQTPVPHPLLGLQWGHVQFKDHML